MAWGMARENLELSEAQVAGLEGEKAKLLERVEGLETELRESRAENTHIRAFRTTQQAETYERTIRNRLTEKVKVLKAQVGSLKEERVLDQDAIRNMAQEQQRLKEKSTVLENANSELSKRAADLEKQFSRRKKGAVSHG